MTVGVVARRHDTVDSFRASSETYLLRREAEHCLMLGLAAGHPAHRPPGDDSWFATVEAGGVVVGAALHGGPFDVVLSHLDHAAAAAVLCDLAVSEGRTLPGVFGSRADADPFAHRWTEHHGGTFEVTSEERIHRLVAVVPPAPVPGSPRHATTSDRALLVGWLTAFHLEALGHAPADVDAAVDMSLAGDGQRLWLWVRDGEPVAMAGTRGPTPSGICIGAVYTPPEHRGRGLASNLVAAVSQAELDAGRRECYLYTDLANPTPNRIYAAIGYEPVADVFHLRFRGGADGGTSAT